MSNADTFHVIGDHVYFRGYHVAVLTSQIPATVYDAVTEALHGYHPDAIDPDEHKGDLDALEKALEDLGCAEERVSELESELDDERDNLTHAQERAAELEELLEAVERVNNDLRAELSAAESIIKALRP